MRTLRKSHRIDIQLIFRAHKNFAYAKNDEIYLDTKYIDSKSVLDNAIFVEFTDDYRLIEKGLTVDNDRNIHYLSNHKHLNFREIFPDENTVFFLIKDTENSTKNFYEVPLTSADVSKITANA